MKDWLMKYGLEDYYPNFEKSDYIESRALADMKGMDEETITKLFGIKKKAHMKKLMAARSKLKYPNQGRFPLIFQEHDRTFSYKIICIAINFCVNKKNLGLSPINFLRENKTRSQWNQGLYFIHVFVFQFN